MKKRTIFIGLAVIGVLGLIGAGGTPKVNEPDEAVKTYKCISYNAIYNNNNGEKQYRKGDYHTKIGYDLSKSKLVSYIGTDRQILPYTEDVKDFRLYSAGEDKIYIKEITDHTIKAIAVNKLQVVEQNCVSQ